jgi:hypothetical protein
MREYLGSIPVEHQFLNLKFVIPNNSESPGIEPRTSRFIAENVIQYTIRKM